MSNIQKKLATFPSVYSKDYKFFKHFKRPERYGSFESYKLGPTDAALFRVPVSEKIDPTVVNEDVIALQDKDPNYLKSIYQSDFKGEKLKTWTEECTGDLVEEAERRLARPGRQPLAPLISSLRVTPGLPRYYHLPLSEFEDTISKFGLERLEKATIDNKAKQE